MSAPFDPQQQGSDVPVDGSDQDELEVEESRPTASGSEPSGGDVTGADATGDPADSPVRHDDEDEAGGGPVFRRPQAGDRLHADDLGA